ncbi:endopeptidase La [[Mycoplasma] mobile]|uniref:Lon protease n=1 Tax=Mycoplasma mobile (strain ATCC 43663 / 163K / NCTC 11711) TaxID=267748 RepID=LON_MYCM1|nr:endopeptidase La [[Mycoplasma] mobile]Q6KI22.1 RecName: Full=Lon protease; AltName: Full=ATP-dependent protease La [Mycoplasma mobile 163K]AAT27754.1 ATP-dependent Lon protease [Mycoplasma mobile 163K]
MKYPFMATRGVITFIGNSSTIEVGRPLSLAAIDLAKSDFENKLVLIPQKNIKQNEIEFEKDLENVGILTKIKSIKILSNGNRKIIVEGVERIKLDSIEKDKNNNDIIANLSLYPVLKNENGSSETIIEKMQTSLNNIIESNLPLVANQELSKHESSERYTYILAHYLTMPFEKKFEIFAKKSLTEMLELIFSFLVELKNIQKLDVDLDKDIKKNLDSQQREYLLRERLKVIQKKLGDDENDEEEIEEKLNSKYGKEQYPEEVIKTIKNEKRRLKNMMSSSPEANTSRTYIEWLTNLPWRKVSVDKTNLVKSKEILDSYHYGLKEVKERIIEFLAVMINNNKKHPEDEKTKIQIPNSDYEINKNLFTKKNASDDTYSYKSSNNVPILALVGPPGTGKTSLAKAIAETLDRKFIKISLGGVKDEAEIRGHRRTYVGALPGKIIQAIKKAGVSNPVILLDEIDKMSSDYKGDPTSAMLEVLDPEQNVNFQDHYIELEYDLSKVLFIATANYYQNISAPLLDRVEIIELSSYTSLEKIRIARDYLIKKVLEQNSLEESQFKISDESLDFLIKHYTLEAGVRNLQRALDKLARKIVVKSLENKLEKDFVITSEEIVNLLGVIKYTDDFKENYERIGAVNGLAYTQYGGSTLSIEVTTFPNSKGGIKLTGQLKEVMQESAQIALAFVRSNAKKYEIDFNFEANQIHIHVPEGAVPKDGPSAGVTFTTAIISALKQIPVSHKVGMTGEITLRGKVLPIGGLKEKSLAAHKLGIKTVFIPNENNRNLVEVADEVKESIEFISVSDYDEIFENLFGKLSDNKKITSNSKIPKKDISKANPTH